MQTRSATWIAFGAAAVFGFGVACVVDLPPEGKYTCTADPDCGGGGYVCTPASAGTRYCCKQDGDEVCDGKDNDCNGVTDDIAPDPCYDGLTETLGVGLCHGGTQACADGGVICAGQAIPVPELCNQADENCNGVADDGFDFRNDPRNCGRCGVGCAFPLRCEDGGCDFPTEANCSDGIDNDGDNATDCADSDCVTQACGTGCVCKNFGKSENLCSDSVDNDSDNATDCADSDCDGGSCGTGCQCNLGNKLETLCTDQADNDGDGATDCADSDCDGVSCGAGCICQGGQVRETICTNSADDDSDTFTDCADTDCDGGSCGTNCQCLSGFKTETNCRNNNDDDGDTRRDCFDLDCVGKSCGNGGRTCKADGGCS